MTVVKNAARFSSFLNYPENFDKWSESTLGCSLSSPSWGYLTPILRYFPFLFTAFAISLLPPPLETASFPSSLKPSLNELINFSRSIFVLRRWDWSYRIRWHWTDTSSYRCSNIWRRCNYEDLVRFFFILVKRLMFFVDRLFYCN